MWHLKSLVSPTTVEFIHMDSSFLMPTLHRHHASLFFKNFWEILKAENHILQVGSGCCRYHLFEDLLYPKKAVAMPRHMGPWNFSDMRSHNFMVHYDGTQWIIFIWMKDTNEGFLFGTYRTLNFHKIDKQTILLETLNHKLKFTSGS